MRHIKPHTEWNPLYESTTGGFEEIESLDVDKLYTKFVKFPEAKLKKLEKFGKISVYLYGKEVEVVKNDYAVEIYCDDDEWYYVSYSGEIKIPIISGSDYYKCDQWDGLINCLNSIYGNNTK